MWCCIMFDDAKIDDSRPLLSVYGKHQQTYAILFFLMFSIIKTAPIGANHLKNTLFFSPMESKLIYEEKHYFYFASNIQYFNPRAFPCFQHPTLRILALLVRFGYRSFQVDFETLLYPIHQSYFKIWDPKIGFAHVIFGPVRLSSTIL